MTEYTTLGENEIEDILSGYGFSEVISWSILSGGWTNTNHLVNTEQGKIVLTVIEEKSLEETRSLARLLEYLDKNDFSTTKLFTDANDNYVSVWNDKSILVKSYIEGSVIENLPGDVLELIGHEIARLNQLPVPDFAPLRFSFAKDFFDDVAAYEPDSSYHQWLLGVRSYVESYISEDLPTALIHSDLFFNNVIISTDQKQATIMDFEEACHYYRVLDVAMAIVGLCCPGEQLDLEKARSLLKGYQDHTQFDAEEISALQAFTVYAAAATSFWRHRQYRFRCPDKDMLNHYLSMHDLANYVKSMSNSSFMSIVET